MVNTAIYAYSAILNYKDFTTPILSHQHYTFIHPFAPNLRFPEFTDEWTTYRFEDIATFFSGGTPASSEKSFYGGDIPFIRSGEIHSDSTGLFLTKDGVDASSAKMVDEGDLLIALYGATSGDISICKIKGAINQAVLCVRTAQNKFFLKGAWEKHSTFVLRTYLQGGQGNLSADIVKKLQFSLPSPREQDKIACLLSLVETRIATQSEAIRDLNLLKDVAIDQLILQKPRNAEMSQVCSISEQIKVIADPEKILTVRLKGKGICWSQAENLELGATQYYKRKEGQLIYGKQNFHNGAIDIVPQCFDGGITSKDIPSFDINSKICNPHYLLAQISSPRFYKPVEALTTGTGSKRLHENSFLKIPIVLPSLEEQNGIVALIESLNHKLSNEEKYYGLLCNQKNHLLQNMFI